jgi:hypothetical protein
MFCAPAWIVAVVVAAPAAHADPPDPALAWLTGASVFAGGFLAGGAIAGSANGDESAVRFGWMTIEGAFVLAPLASHAVVGEWTRGLAFAAVPAAAFATSAVLLGFVPDAIDHGLAPARSTIWSCLTAGLLTGVAGVIDAALVDGRAPVSVAPMAASGELGLLVRGTL